ncbi:MAG: M14 family metallopeptidase [Gemmatimonadota bacterium]
MPTQATKNSGVPIALAAIIAVALTALVPASLAAQERPGSALASLRTRAERSGFTETSSQSDILSFLDSLQARGGQLLRGVVARTVEGRDIPWVAVSRPLYPSPADARASGRPIVYVQGNIHSGEVEGKEAMQAMLRDLLAESRPNVLDSIVLIVVPNYNADGNEKLDLQSRNRGAQNGPEMVGTRPNAMGLNLNRDYIKADAPETRGSLRMFREWDPHVFVDLHTTNGSYHGYNLTWAPSLNPAAEIPGVIFGAARARDSLLPVVEERTAARRAVKTFPYGNFASDEGGSAGGAGGPRAWLSYDHRPRFGTNYYALRGRVAVLTEAYSHDPFQRRVESTYAFVAELLSLIAERSRTIVENARAADRALGSLAGRSITVPVRSRLTTSPRRGPVTYEILERTTDTTRREPGVRSGMRRTGRYVTDTMAIHDRFEPVLRRPVPAAYAVDARDTSAINLLALHGVTLLRSDAAWTGAAGPQFVADSTIIAPRPFEGRREVRVEGRWVERGEVTLVAGTIVVPTSQRLGVLAMYLLEPESDDGMVTWDQGNRSAGVVPPIVRLQALPSGLRPYTP